MVPTLARHKNAFAIFTFIMISTMYIHYIGISTAELALAVSAWNFGTTCCHVPTNFCNYTAPLLC